MISPSSLDLLASLIQKTCQGVASDVELLYSCATSLSVETRNAKLDSLEQSTAEALSVRVFVEKKQAIVSTTDLSPASLDSTLNRAVEMAAAAPEDAFCGLPSPDEIATVFPSLECADPTPFPTADTLTQMALSIEDAMLAVKGVSLSDGTSAGVGKTSFLMMASNGFVGTHEKSRFSLSASAVAGTGTEMVQDNDYLSCAFGSDLPSPQSIGQRAGQRAISRLNSRKIGTMQGSVVFAPRVANSLLGHFSSAINGNAIARGTSFLKDYLGKPVFSPSISIIDDPFRKRGLRSRPFDGEGLAPSRRNLIDQGVLTTWLLDCRSARQLKLKSTGSAGLRTGGLPAPSPSNLWIAAGQETPESLISNIKNGLYITDLMGDGVNAVTGDYSRAAAGFWIENGQIAYPVNEITIAGNLKTMFLEMTAANDLEYKYGIDAPTVRIDSMTIAGT